MLGFTSEISFEGSSCGRLVTDLSRHLLVTIVTYVVTLRHPLVTIVTFLDAASTFLTNVNFLDAYPLFTFEN